MALDPKLTNPDKIVFDEADFTLLMQRRIRKVLLIASSYDAFMLEEDGRIEEQIFSEYVSLNLRQPPGFIHADTARKAFEILEAEKIDLVIQMLNIPDIDPFELAHQIKSKYPGTPVVALTHFSREVSLKLRNEDTSALDYVFCWLGNANLILAIIKLIEDKMNAGFDTNSVGVQCILLVEDSVRFTSVYLPILYKIVFTQSQEFLKEALNEHQRRLRMRGRPKILLARTYTEAIELYQKFKHNLLGVISDISVKEDFSKPEEKKGGVSLCELVKANNPFLPVVFQSSDIENETLAHQWHVGFIHKYSKTLAVDLQNYISQNFGFGDFVFRNPDTLEEISRAKDLVTFQHQILTVPDISLRYHSARNDLSKWLYARSLFPIADIFRKLQIDDFDSLNDIRDYLYKAIGSYRISRARGVIATFNPDFFDEYQLITRIGEGSVGGKARGLVFLSALIKRFKLESRFPDVQISVPRSVVLTTSVFEEFMESNRLYQAALSDISDEEILNLFLNAVLPEYLNDDLLALTKWIKNPVAVRSSSKLEDSQYQPFAGIYTTYMVPLSVEQHQTVQNIKRAIKAVYASVYYKGSKAYMAATSNIIDEEKMGIVIQEVCGNHYVDRFYPTFSGVARSINFYPVKPERSVDGIANLGFGLGKYVVDGGATLRFSPKYPKNVLQLSSVNTALKETQKIFYALDLNDQNFSPTTDDGSNLLKLKVSEAENDQTLRFVASTFDQESNMIRDGIHLQGRRIVTFANILQHNIFPLAELLSTILEIGEQEMGNPIEIEFAANLDVPKGKRPVFNFLQIRPIVFNDQRITFSISNIEEEKKLIYSQNAMGNGLFENLSDVVYVKPDVFQASATKEIAAEIERINHHLAGIKRNYILIGPGRWGSSDPWLGIPVKWPQISEARVIVEVGLQNFRVDPSQGTHFFQNLTSFRVAYVTVNPYLNEGMVDFNYLNQLPAISESLYIRHVQFTSLSKGYINGRINTGVILKPGFEL